MRLTLKAINDELAKRGYTARLARARGYFYFQFGEAAYWLDRTVNLPTLNSLTLPEWITEFELLRKINCKQTGGHRSDQSSVVRRATVNLPCPRPSNSASRPNPPKIAEMLAGKIRGKRKMAPRRKENKSN
jgi:hypothetical protein